MKILLTGASGFLGSVLKKGLESQYPILTVGRSNQSDILCNLTVGKFKCSSNVDMVIHCAGKAHMVPKNAQESQLFFDVNLNATINLCKSLEDLTTLPKTFIFVSTVAVYGKDEGEMISEDHPLEGRTPYALSKIQAENFLREWSIKNSIQLTVLRLPLLAGENPPGNLGAMIKGIETGRYLSIGRAKAKKSILLAEDIIKIIPLFAIKGGTYNLTDGYHPSFRELERLISKQLNKKNPVSIPLWIARILAKAGDLSNDRLPINSAKLSKMISTLTFDDTLARRELGWNPKPVLSNWSIK